MSVAIFAVLAGAVVGLALGGLGGGGSILTVPALIYVIGFTPVAATTASLVVVAVTSATALTAHAREGNVQWRTGLLFAAAGTVPAILGGALAAQLPGRVLTLAFAGVATAAGVRMLRGGGSGAASGAEGDSRSGLAAGAALGRKGGAALGWAAGPGPGAGGDPSEAGSGARGDSSEPGPGARGGSSSGPVAASALPPCGGSTSGPALNSPSGQADSVPVAGPAAESAPGSRGVSPSAEGEPVPAVRPVKALAAGAGLGAVTGVLGVGGGFLAVPALVGVLRLGMRAAVGTSLLVITVNSLAALALRAGTVHDLDWARMAPFAGAALLGAWDGRRLAAKVSPAVLRRTFGAVLLGVAVLMLVDGVL